MRPWQYYLHMARRWAILVTIPVILAGILAYYITSHETRIYQATTTLYVQQSTNQFGVATTGGTDISSSVIASPTYTQMLNTIPTVLAPAVNAVMDKKWPGYGLRAHPVTASQPALAESQIIQVGIQDWIPQRAADAANAVAHAFTARISQIESARYARDEKSIERQLKAAQLGINTTNAAIDVYHGKGVPTALTSQLTGYETTYATLFQNLQQLKINHDSGANVISVYAPATVPTVPIAPHPLRTTLIAMILVLVLSVAGILVYDYIDDSFRDPEEVEAAAGAPILGVVHRFEEQQGQLVTRIAPNSPAAETYRRIRTNVEYTGVDEPRRVLLVTSALPAEGKTTTASNLATVISESGRSVVLMDADLRRPTIHRVFALDSSTAGLANLLVPNHQLNGTGISRLPDSNLFVMPSGPRPPNPADLLGTERMRDVIEHCRQKADLVIIDSPPVLSVSDSAILARFVDGVVLVIDPRKTKRRELIKARESIEAVGGKVVGVVINRLVVSGDLFGAYYGYYRSWSYYGYGGYGGYGYGTYAAEKGEKGAAPLQS